ncbi:hypothetical protein ABPG77_009472 [Micractinium sp. CCAP 211/92]
MLLLNDTTKITGGATVYQGIVTWLPSCSRTTESAINVKSAQNFDLTTTAYITDAHRGGAHARQRCHCVSLGQLLLLGLTLAAIGVCAWGLGESILSTDSTVSDFWSLVDQVEGKIADATSDLQQLRAEMTQLSGNVTVVTQRASLLAATLRRVGLNASATNRAVAALQALPTALDSVASSVQGGIDVLNNTTVSDIRADWEDTTMSIQDTVVWAGHLDFRCLLPAVLAGLMRGVYTGTTDTCLYVDALALDLAHRKISDPSQRTKVVQALEYYLGITYIPDSEVVDRLLGVPTQLLHLAVAGPAGSLLLPVLANSALASTARVLGMPDEAATAFQNISTLIPAASATVARLEGQALKSSIDPLHHDTKIYMQDPFYAATAASACSCCTLSNESYDVWVAWTVAGVLCFVLALLCSLRIGCA